MVETVEAFRGCSAPSSPFRYPWKCHPPRCILIGHENLCCAVIGLLCSTPVLSAEGPGRPPTWTVRFSPHGGCTEVVVEALGRARRTVLVQAYSFTSTPIAKALVDAHRRGVKVEVVLDKSQRTEKYSSATFLTNSGIPTSIDVAHAIAHNKVMVIDGQTVITGSFNFTKAAEENNAENLLVISDLELAARYAQNWSEHRRYSEVYAGLVHQEPPRQPENRRR